MTVTVGPLDGGFSTDEDGTGFGLSIVETICRAHGWDIELLDGPGARFEVTGVGPPDRVYPLGDDLNLSPRRSGGRSD